MTSAPDIAANLAATRDAIDAACRKWDRPAGSVRLLAVSKTKPAAMVNAALAAGQYDFGENYLQDAESKIPEVGDPRATWHFIGAIQSNKTRTIAGRFGWVHTVSSEKVARRLHEQRPDNLPPLQVLLQVNVSGEASKGGLEPGDVAPLVSEIADYDRIAIRGLMAIPAPEPDFEKQRVPFRRLRELRDEIAVRFADRVVGFTELSMGMSGDLEAAIAEGATWVRVGTAIFGARNTTAHGV